MTVENNDDLIIDALLQCTNNKDALSLSQLRSYGGKTLLHRAAEFGYLKAFLLYSKLADVEAVDDDGNTPLHTASARGHLDIVQFLIEKHGVNPQCRNSYGCTPLHLSSLKGHLEVNEYLIKQVGVDVNVQDDIDYTPLHYACAGGSVQIVMLLLLSWADPFIGNSLSTDLVYPEQFAVKHGYSDLALMLNQWKKENPQRKRKKRMKSSFRIVKNKKSKTANTRNDASGFADESTNSDNEHSTEQMACHPLFDKELNKAAARLTQYDDDEYALPSGTTTESAPTRSRNLMALLQNGEPRSLPPLPTPSLSLEEFTPYDVPSLLVTDRQIGSLNTSQQTENAPPSPPPPVPPRRYPPVPSRQEQTQNRSLPPTVTSPVQRRVQVSATLPSEGRPVRYLSSLPPRPPLSPSRISPPPARATRVRSPQQTPTSQSRAPPPPQHFLPPQPRVRPPPLSRMPPIPTPTLPEDTFLYEDLETLIYRDVYPEIPPRMLLSDDASFPAVELPSAPALSDYLSNPTASSTVTNNGDNITHISPSANGSSQVTVNDGPSTANQPPIVAITIEENDEMEVYCDLPFESVRPRASTLSTDGLYVNEPAVQETAGLAVNNDTVNTARLHEEANINELSCVNNSALETEVNTIAPYDDDYNTYSGFVVETEAGLQVSNAATNSRANLVSRQEMSVTNTRDGLNVSSENDAHSNYGTSANVQMLPSAIGHYFDEFVANPDSQRQLDQTLTSVSRQVSTLASVCNRTLVLRREHLLEDLFDAYNRWGEQLTSQRIAIEFAGEQGLDYGGLTKDTFTIFWERLFDSRFQGEDAKVPQMSSNVRGDHAVKWKLVGKILSHCVALTGMLPVKFCRSTLAFCINKQAQIPDEVLVNDFLLYLSSEQRELVKQALDNFVSLTEEKRDQLVDIFSQYAHTELPSERTFKSQIIELATRELIVKPSYICDLIGSGIPQTYKKSFWRLLTVSHLTLLYSSCIPTSAKVNACLTTSETNLTCHEKLVVFCFLKMTIDSFDKEQLERFLHYVTGTSMLSSQPIRVSFSGASGLARRPIAHTCSNTLELSTKYDSFADFYTELVTVLNDDRSFEMTAI